MRRKRLRHTALVLCEMFCGWRLDSSKPRLVELGSGILEIDVLKGQCLFEGKPAGHLPIADELRLWLLQDLDSNQVSLDVLLGARLRARLFFTLVRWNERKNKTQVFYAGGQPVRTEELHRCEIECESELRTEQAVYRADRKDSEEWPVGWPVPSEKVMT